MVTVAIASLNTRHFTELAIRTAVLRAGCPSRIVVGDAGSTDGTLAMLERLPARLVHEVEVVPGGRYHGEWLDHWVATLDDELVVFVDSDVEFLRRDWLVRLLDHRERNDAAIVGAEWVDALPWYRLPNEDTRVHLAGRPAPWVLLVHRPTIAALGVSFNYRAEACADVPEGILAYDVGGWVAARAEEAGHTVSVMPPDFHQYYRHYRGRSWAASGKRARLQYLAAVGRLHRARLLGR